MILIDDTYILWAKSPKVAEEGSEYLRGWHILEQTGDPAELFIAKVKAEENWNEVYTTKTIELNVEIV